MKMGEGMWGWSKSGCACVCVLSQAGRVAGRVVTTSVISVTQPCLIFPDKFFILYSPG